jgi:hypothetical protein
VIRRGAPFLALVVLLAAGCGGGGDARKVLSQTASSLGDIHSGDLTMRLVVSPRKGTRGRIGFELHGPFAIKPGGLPVAKIAYTQIAGSRQATATLISTGVKAYAEVNGKTYELPANSTNVLRQAAAGVGGGQGLGELRIDDWLEHPKVSGGGKVGGADTDHVTADLDVVAAANDLLALVRRLGRAAPTIEGRSADQLRHAVRSSSIDVWSGKDDHLLRRLRLKVDLGFDVPDTLKRALGDVVGAKVDFDLAISAPNKTVSVPPPVNALPPSALPGG